MNLLTLKKVTLEALRKSYVSSEYEKKYLFNNAYKTRASMSIYIYFCVRWMSLICLIQRKKGPCCVRLRYFLPHMIVREEEEKNY